MKQTLIPALFVVAVLFMLPAQSASACMNDREVESVEREFETNYNKKKAPLQVNHQQENEEPMMAMSLSGGGVLLLIGGVVLVLLGSGKQE